MLRSNRYILLAVALFIALGIVTGGVILAQTTMTFPLAAQNDSGENGTAILTDLGNGKVRVDVEISGAPAGVPQPMHIHKGTCETLDPAPAFPLTSVVDGKSTTEVDTTIADLMASPYAINGHKSAAEASVYVFCGNLSKVAMQATVTGTVAAESPTAAATAEATTAATEAATTAATAEATVEATAVATAEATVEATVEATTTPPTQLPSTGADSPINALIPIALLGIIALLVGYGVRRMAR